MFYTYFWCRENGTPYYVGKGKGVRAFESHGHSVKRPKDRSRIFVQNWESEEKAFEMEKWWISFWGRKILGTGCLLNFTEGGEGPSGFKHKNRKGHRDSEETRKKKSKSRKGIKYSEETLRRMRDAHLGYIPSEAARSKNGLAHRGKITSEETKAKMREAAKNRVISEQTRKRMSEAAKAKYKRLKEITMAFQSKD
jgi:hypothetical protein